MTGIGNSTDPMAAMLKEATEEVLITTGSGRVLVPQFLDQKYSLYNEIVGGRRHRGRFRNGIDTS